MLSLPCTETWGKSLYLSGSPHLLRREEEIWRDQWFPNWAEKQNHIVGVAEGGGVEVLLETHILGPQAYYSKYPEMEPKPSPSQGTTVSQWHESQVWGLTRHQLILAGFSQMALMTLDGSVTSRGQLGVARWAAGAAQLSSMCISTYSSDQHAKLGVSSCGNSRGTRKPA